MLLDQSIKLHKSLLRSLAELVAHYRRLLDTSTDYDDFLAQNLLWIRSAPPIDLGALRTLPQETALLLSPADVRRVATWLADGIPLAAVLEGIDLHFDRLARRDRLSYRHPRRR